VIVLRGGGERLEVLLVQRNPAARFMGGAWVFPGGAVDAGEDHRSAGAREVREEAGLEVATLTPFSRWITPPQVKTRFDTLFFLASAPAGSEPRPDGGETVDLRWFRPRDALAAHRRGEIAMVFPTIKTLEQIARFDSADALVAWASTHEVKPVQPRVEGQGETARIVVDEL